MSNASVKPGDVLAGKYRVEKILGAGGMGYVVAARHLQLDQLVAMKFLRKGAVENQEAGTRFLREAKAAVKLRNEHIAKVFDVGTLESGEPYIVMEHLDGCDLSAMAKERHILPVAEACEYVLQASEALAEAHSLGIIHRDIKLANLFVTRGPAGGPLVKVLDFGISKTNPFGESEHDMTRTASMLGSPRFMSPEQMRDPRAVDGRTDIWSLGVVLYRLIAGRPPFEADTLGRLLTMVMHEQEAPLGSVRKDLPPGFSEVVGHCLQKDPTVRFGSVAELAYAIAPYTMEPDRARSSADRIAQVLSLPNSNRSDVSHPMSMGLLKPMMPLVPPQGSVRSGDVLLARRSRTGASTARAGRLARAIRAAQPRRGRARTTRCGRVRTRRRSRSPSRSRASCSPRCFGRSSAVSHRSAAAADDARHGRERHAHSDGSGMPTQPAAIQTVLAPDPKDPPPMTAPMPTVISGSTVPAPPVTGAARPTGRPVVQPPRPNPTAQRGSLRPSNPPPQPKSGDDIPSTRD